MKSNKLNPTSSSLLRCLLILGVGLSTVATGASTSQTATPQTARFGPLWNPLIGDWTGDGSGVPGTGGGRASFQFDLEKHVIIRRNVSDYPASGDHPAVHHEDLMIIYPGASESKGSAFYVDNEGQTIEYSASWLPNGKELVFVTSSANGPQFRLTYTISSPDTMTIDFEMAPPGSTAFKKYVGGIMRRSNAK